MTRTVARSRRRGEPERLAQPRESAPGYAHVLALQRSAGNRAVAGVLARSATSGAAPAAAPPALSVTGDAEPRGCWEHRQWGHTWPQTVEATISARRDGTGWVPVVTGLAGHYSIRTRLLPGVEQVTGPGGNTTAENHCKQIADLDSLAPRESPKVDWYMIEAVEAHEAVHATRMDPSFHAIADEMVEALESARLADDGTLDETTAAARLQDTRDFEKQLGNARDIWIRELVFQAAFDDVPNGPTAQAERAIVDPMIAAIRAEAAARSWPACP